MEKIIRFLLIVTADKLTHGKAINNGYTLKFNPIFVKEDVAPDNGPLFAKISQEPTKESTLRREFMSKAFFPHSEDFARGCTNQVAKILFSRKMSESLDLSDGNNNTSTFDEYIKIPIVSQPFPEYKIIVATAPWNVKISGAEAKPVVIYIVFPGDDEESNNINVPSIYFVKKGSALIDLNKKEKIDPVLIIDNNRTVTGIKSKAIAKVIKFKSNLNSRYNNYEVTR